MTQSQPLPPLPLRFGEEVAAARADNAPIVAL